MEYREPPTQNANAGQKSRVLNPTVTEPVTPEIENDPDVITLTISEVDRQTANEFTDIHNCLICTALRNRGYNLRMVGPDYVSMVEFEDWKFEREMGPIYLCKDYNATSAPFYGPSVVGKVIRLRKVK